MSNLFSWVNPYYWFLNEKDKKKYNINRSGLSQYEKEVNITKLDYSGNKLQEKLLDIKLEHEKITPLEHDLSLARLHNAGDVLKMTELSIRLKHNDIDQHEHDIELVNIQYGLVPEALEKAIVEVELRHGNITQKEADERLLALLPDGKEKKLKQLQLKHQHREISDNEYNKQKATIDGESYINVIKVDLDDDGNGSFELDWNDLFIEELKEAGIKGKTEEDIASQWLDSICKSIALDAYSGIGDFEERLSEVQYIKSEKK